LQSSCTALKDQISDVRRHVHDVSPREGPIDTA
jgi:hypothetical protein